MKKISVSTALSPFVDFSMIPKDVLLNASERGTRTHAFCASYALGLFPGAIDDDCTGYFNSFKTWFDKYVNRVFFVEEHLTHSQFDYDGHPDLYCELIDGRRVVVDLKTPAVESKTWRAQLAAYVELICDTALLYDGKLKPVECMALMLKKNGNPPRAVVYQYQARDFAAFLSALNAYKYFKS